jgi:hypothetical protein
LSKQAIARRHAASQQSAKNQRAQKREVKAKRHSTSRGGWARCGIVLWVVLPRLTTQQPGKKPVSTD